jgi:hypothetical protein
VRSHHTVSCEPWLGENRANCTDCANANLNPILYTLVIDELKTKADHLQGKYVINLAYSIQNDDNTIEYGHRDHTTSDHMASDIYPTLAKLGAWGNGCPQKRTKTRIQADKMSQQSWR